MVSANIAVVGSLNIDHIVITNRLPDLGETYLANEYHNARGGKAANAAVSAYRSCHRNPKAEALSDPVSKDGEVDISVSFIGAVGKDAGGAAYVKFLSDDGLNTAGMRVIDEMTTGMAFIIVEEDSRDNRILTVAGSNDFWTPDHFTTIEAWATE